MVLAAASRFGKAPAEPQCISRTYSALLYSAKKRCAKLPRLGLDTVLGNGGSEQPLFQHVEELRTHLTKCYANPEIRLRVHNHSARLEEFPLGINLDIDLRVLGPRVRHVQIATVKAKLGHAGRDTCLR